MTEPQPHPTPTLADAAAIGARLNRDIGASVARARPLILAVCEEYDASLSLMTDAILHQMGRLCSAGVTLARSAALSPRERKDRLRRRRKAARA